MAAEVVETHATRAVNIVENRMTNVRENEYRGDEHASWKC